MGNALTGELPYLVTGLVLSSCMLYLVFKSILPNFWFWDVA